jgi:hypothetical protein
MPKISFSKESLEPKPSLPDGLYEIRLEGFEPDKSKKGDSVNLRPILKVINHPQHTGSRVFDNLNVGANWILEAFVHAFGQPLIEDGAGNMNIPGDFNGPDDNPKQWSYSGPLTGAVGKVFLKQTEYNGKMNPKVDQWMCAVPGCQKKHPTGLAK